MQRTAQRHWVPVYFAKHSMFLVMYAGKGLLNVKTLTKYKHGFELFLKKRKSNL